MHINYITNLDVDEISGGWSGMNHNVYEQLGRKFKIHLIQKVDPPYSRKDRYVSKAQKVLGIRRVFPAFTAERLRRIANEVTGKIDLGAKLNFYHGATPWLFVKNNVPYAVYLDCCFASYTQVYHKQEAFSKRQLNWLFEREADFLGSAASVFFSSNWALENARKLYQTGARNFYVAGLGGGFDDKKQLSNPNEIYFLFVGLDFFGKGGDKVVEAFSEIQKNHPGVKLKIVGERPPANFLSTPNVEYTGRLNKSHQPDLITLTGLFKNAYCFVLPTSKDMTPLVLVEAASVGCPAIATDSFGIPEIVKHNETGILIDGGGPLKEQLVIAMNQIIVNKTMHEAFSENSRIHAESNFSWDRTGRIICNKLMESFF